MCDSDAGDKVSPALRLNNSLVETILNRLDGKARSPARERRRSKRHVYRANAVVIRIEQTSAASSSTHRVSARNIGESGMALLHNRYFYVGTLGSLQLVTRHGSWTSVPGRIIHCRCIEGNVHEVGIHFERALDPSMYCSTADERHALVVDDDTSFARLCAFQLGKLNITSEHVLNGRAAVEEATKNSYDMILMDMEMPELDGFSATKELRRSGYTGPIIAMTAMTELEVRQRCLESGCDKYLAKPFCEKDLFTTIESLSDDPLCSSLASESREEKGGSPEPDRRRLRELNEDLDLLVRKLSRPPTDCRHGVFDALMLLRSEINGAFEAPGCQDES